MNERKILITEDGSHNIYVPELDESYHSTHGAIGESKHVFIENGLNYLFEKEQKEHINIFEVGFGTGLNALLCAVYAHEHHIHIRYEGIEAFPLSGPEIQKLNYAELIKNPLSKKFFQRTHAAPWDQWVDVSSSFRLKKVKNTMSNFTSAASFDICFFDAFAPSKQPEMWEPPVLQKVRDLLVPNGVFVTYCAKGQLKRDLNNIGFLVESLPGPPGKFEMVRAIKT
jgi:tRNA U34 5-methylaminomethyl-2-thiouridine-forming methyltransferase MnmC